MNHEFNGDWEGTKQRYEAWWQGENTDGPIMAVQVARDGHSAQVLAQHWARPADENETPEESLKKWTDPETILADNLARFGMAHFTGDSYPRISAPLGPTGLAAYLGAEPVFRPDTVWYRPIFEDATEAKLVYDPENPWLKKVMATTDFHKQHEDGRYITGIPELCEQFDVLGEMFESEQFLFELIDNPEDMHRLLKVVQQAWIEIYDLYYKMLADENGFCCYGAFALIGKGKTAKIQCDRSAMISPEMYREFALPYLRELTEKLDKSMYHLDGVDALVHLDSVLSMEKLTALQWTPGAGKADGGDECWDFIYEKAINAGKSIYALVHPANVPRFVKRFGGRGVYIVTTCDTPENADRLVVATKPG